MPSATQSPYSNAEYTVGWISALPIELAAAKGMMDEEHGEPQTPPQPTDDNTYILGRIGKFNVVVACLPKHEIGASSAATVAKDMLWTFPSIRVGLLVGIGAGIPDYDSDDIRDVRLGDVVISSDKENGGVVIYDFGKRLSDGSFKPGYALDRPPTALRTAISRLEAEHETRENKIPDYISDMLEKYPFMRKRGFTYPGQSSDRLFKADYGHRTGSGKSCINCDPAEQVYRDPENRPDDYPLIHYGVIATGSAVVKHSLTREEIKQNHKAICLEMEAAGLMNNFPCVVIRGISDYADSHKNDQWHPYAAATAAACAKELLEHMQIGALEAEQVAKDILTQVGEIETHVAKLSAKSNLQEELDILNWISQVDYATQHNDFITRRQEGTGKWFLDSREFQEWLKTVKQTLYCPGIPGAGKTIITAIVIDYLKKLFQDNNSIGIAYIYCNFQRQDEQKVDDLLLNLLKQLSQGYSPLPISVRDLYRKHKKERSRPSFEEISNTLHSVAAKFARVFIVVDALDECRIADGSLSRFLREISKLQTNSITNIFATSRPNDEISSIFGRSLSLKISATDKDILEYLNAQISLRQSDIIDNDVQTMISRSVLQMAHRMFLLAVLSIVTILSQPTKGDIKEALQDLGKGTEGLKAIYKQTMNRINAHKNSDLANQALTWIVHAKRQLSTTELQHALAVRPEWTAPNEDYLPSIKLIQSICGGLVTVDEESRVIRLVHYTVQEYFNESRREWFPAAESYITTICAVYLSFDAFESGGCHWAKDLEERLRAYPLYSYAARHWGHHAGECSESNPKVISFLQRKAKTTASYDVIDGGSSFYYPFSFYFLKNENIRNENISGLHLAAYFGLAQETHALLSDSHFADVESCESRTSLSWTTKMEDKAIVKLLEKGNIFIDSRDDSGRTPLSLAAWKGHEAVVKLLLDTVIGILKKISEVAILHVREFESII